MVSKAQQLVDILTDIYGDEPTTLSASKVKEIAKENGIPSLYRVLNKNNMVEDGRYNFPPVGKSSGGTGGRAARSVRNITPISAPVATPALQAEVPTLGVVHSGFTENLIPVKDSLFVPFGQFKTIAAVVKTNMFYPMFLTGLSGCGKTKMVDQACAGAKREVIRVNFTIETDEDDLIGGFRLIDGETKFFKGPVISAMERGAVLLCDEIDLANPAKVMCLQSILEGSGYFIKKTGEYISPAEGFTVIATANTKGKGSEDGQFIGTNVLNEAFLERFPITCEQEYPTPATEARIIKKVFEDLDLEEEEFTKKLVDWADIIRKTYADDGVDEIISTRRLIDIAKAFAIFGDRATAIDLCTSRFDDETKHAFLELYSKLDAGIDMNATSETGFSVE